MMDGSNSQLRGLNGPHQPGNRVRPFHLGLDPPLELILQLTHPARGLGALQLLRDHLENVALGDIERLTMCPEVAGQRRRGSGHEERGGRTAQQTIHRMGSTFPMIRSAEIQPIAA